jgi:hypothetical protein
MKIHKWETMCLVVLLFLLGVAGAPAFAVYVDNKNGTVTDTRTGLVWQQADDGVARTWADAGPYCENLVLGGYGDWRLPRIDELETLVDYSRYDPAIYPVFSDRSAITGRAVPPPSTRTTRGSFISTLATRIGTVRPTAITSGVCAGDHFGPSTLWTIWKPPA